MDEVKPKTLVDDANEAAERLEKANERKRFNSVFLYVSTSFFIISASCSNFSASFFFLAFIYHDSVSGLDPRVLLRSIRDTFWPYMWLVLLFVLLAGMVRIIFLELRLSIFWVFVLRFVMLYAGLILAHLTGRFYWRYKEKLKWDLKSR